MPLVTNAFGREVLRDIERRGISAEGVLQLARLTRATVDAEEGWIPHQAHCALFEAAATALGDPLYGAKLGRHIDPRVAGLIVYSGLAAETLGKASRNFSRYLALIDRAEKMDIQVREATWVLSTPKPQDPLALQANMFMTSLQNATFCELVDCEVRPLAMSFPDPHQRHNISEIEEFFGCPVTFGGPLHQVFSSKDMARRVVTADPHLAKIVKAYGEQLLKQRAEVISGDVALIASTVIKHLPNRPVTSVAIAETLGVSERTLRRRAAKAGTTVGKIVADTRARLAAQYIDSGKFKLKEVAYLCGYRSVGAFSAARRNWHSMC